MKTLVKNTPLTATLEAAHPQQYITPDVNIYETKDGYALEAEMPGVNKDGLEITLADHQISILGHPATEGVSGETLFRERRGASYRRIFDLDPAIDTTRIVARMNQGVLFLSLPKSEAVKPRKIVVSE